MNVLLERAFAALRLTLGLNDPADTRLHAPHGWLLPPTPIPVMIPSMPSGMSMRRAESGR